MKQPFPFRVNIGFLLNQPIGTRRDIHFDVPAFQLSIDLEAQAITGVTRLTRTGQGILVDSQFDASVPADCVRCLVNFLQPLHISFTDLFAFNPDQATESGLLVPDDGNIDLAPMVMEYLILEIPIQPICRPECKGLCPVCGADLNTAPCEHSAA